MSYSRIRQIRLFPLLVLCSKCCVVLVSCFLTGEIFLRLMFVEGASFSHHAGPMVQRFERKFVLTHLEGSRGPEVHSAKGSTALRALVQGDSITWGQGVRNEPDLYTSLLLEKWRADNPCAEMAVIARPGWEIDRHLDKLSRYGPDLDPDVIIYQWFVNDLEMRTKNRRPPVRRFWQVPYLHGFLRELSYFWFYVDFRLDSLLPRGGPTYPEYLLDLFEGDTPEWREFEVTFTQWALEAKSLTPKVLVVLFPAMDLAAEAESYPLRVLHRKVIDLAHELDLETLDLSDELGDLWGNPAKFASPTDAHPSAMVHTLMADHIHAHLLTQWPFLFHVSQKGGACDPLPGNWISHH